MYRSKRVAHIDRDCSCNLPLHTIFAGKSGKGFTLIETVVVIGLTVVAIGAIVVMWSAFSSVFGFGRSTTSAGIEARAIMDEAESLVTPASVVIQSRAFATGTYASGTTTLVTELPSIDSNGAVLVGKYDHAVMYTSNRNAYRRLEADALSARKTGTKQLSTASTTLIFSYDNTNYTEVTKVTATTTVELTVKGQPIGTSFSSLFYLRNHN